MNMIRPLLLTALLSLGLTLPSLAVEKNTQTKTDTTGQTNVAVMQYQNGTSLQNAQNALNALKQEVNAIKACNQNQQLWTGGSCRSVNVTSYNLQSPITIGGRHQTGCSTSCYDDGDWWSGSHIVCNTTCACTCTADELAPDISIIKGVVNIVPKNCNVYSVTNRPC